MPTENIDISLLAEIDSHAIGLANRAGQILLEHFRSPLEVKFKGKKNSDPVTSADRACQDYLNQAIKERFPSHAILSEEADPPSESRSPFVWVLDPLDGTVNFMNGLPLFACSIGVLWRGKPVAGSIYVPLGHTAGPGVYHARLGGGAFFNNDRVAMREETSGRPLCQLPGGLAGRFRLSGESARKPREARNLGSMALELSWTAAGVFEFSLFGRPRLWDVAAGVVLVKEAGGLPFTRAPGEKTWQILEQFQEKEPGSAEDWKSLRDWSQPVLAGPAEAARRVAQDLRLKRNLLSSLKRLIRTR